MEIIRGKNTSFISETALADLLKGYQRLHIDIGTGDGRYVQHLARQHPHDVVIGIDANRENLREISRRAPDNALFTIANALTLTDTLPALLYGMAAQVSINFPWGSLMQGLLDDDPGLMHGLQAISHPRAALEVRLNGGALSEAGWTLEAGQQRVQQVLSCSGFIIRSAARLTADDLKRIPTTWAKRLAFGRDPRAVLLRGVRVAERVPEHVGEVTG